MREEVKTSLGEEEKRREGLLRDLRVFSPRSPRLLFLFTFAARRESRVW
jgi:hypothetical protein